MARQAALIDASGHVVMPGFVDSYTHIASGPSPHPRCFRNPQPRPLDPPTFAAHFASASAACRRGSAAPRHHHARKQVRFRCRRSERNQNPARSRRAAKTLSSPDIHLLRRCSARSGMALFPPPAAHPPPQTCAIRRIHCCDENGFNPDQARRYLLAARQLKFGLQLSTGVGSPPPPSLSPSSSESQASATCSMPRPPTPRVWRNRTSSPPFCPAPSSISERTAYPPARMLIDAGVAVALGSRYHPETSPSQSMQMMIALACGPHGHDACRSRGRGHHQRGPCIKNGIEHRLARIRQMRGSADSRRPGLPRDTLSFWNEPGAHGHKERQTFWWNDPR